MTTTLDRPAIASPSSPRSSLNKYCVNPVEVVSAEPGQYPILEIVRAYVELGQRPIPLCDAQHRFVSPQHINGHQRRDGTQVAPCNSPGKAPLESGYPRFAATVPTDAEITRMFARHQGNIGGVVPEGYVVLDVDPRSGGLGSLVALTGRYGPFPETPTVRTGGNGLHNHFRLPDGMAIPSGGSLADLGFPGVEWKGPGQQVVLPSSVHASGKDYRWEPGFALGEVPVTFIPDWLLELILEQSQTSNRHSHRYVRSGRVQYNVQPPQVQEHFAGLWNRVGLQVQPGAGDQFYSCPFHVEQNPSMHIDAQRCIWNCLAPACPGHHGGGIRELEAAVGPLASGALPAGLVFHVPPQGDADGASVLGDSYPNADAADADPVLEALQTRSKTLFPLPSGQQPKVVSLFCAFAAEPSRAIRHQVISNTWNNPVNRALKKRQLWAHLTRLFARDQVDSLWGISISPEDWNASKREALAAQVQRRSGNYAAFDDRAVAGYVRFLTNVEIPGAMPVEDIDTALFEALRDVDLPEDGEQRRVHLVWLSQGWSLPAHESKGTVQTIACKREVDPVDDANEEEQARQLGLETWTGSESGDPEQWGFPRYFAVPRERVEVIGPERAFDELMGLARQLGYQPVREVRSHLFPAKEPPAVAA